MPDLLKGKELTNTTYPTHKSHKIILSDDYEYNDSYNPTFKVGIDKLWLGLNDQEAEGLKTFLKQAGMINVNDKQAIAIANAVLEKLNRNPI